MIWGWKADRSGSAATGGRDPGRGQIDLWRLGRVPAMIAVVAHVHREFELLGDIRRNVDIAGPRELSLAVRQERDLSLRLGKTGGLGYNGFAWTSSSTRTYCRSK